MASDLDLRGGGGGLSGNSHSKDLIRRSKQTIFILEFSEHTGTSANLHEESDKENLNRIQT